MNAYLGRSERQIDDLVQTMMQAAFEPVTKSFPEITTGDFSPHDHFMLSDALKHGLLAWLWSNAPHTDEVA